MDAPLAHDTLLKHDEVMRASMASRSRRVSATWLAVLLFVGLVAAIWYGGVFAFWFVQRLPFEVMFAVGKDIPIIATAMFAFVVVVLVGNLQNWAIRRAYLKSFATLDIPTEIAAQFEILPEGLRLSTDRIVIFPRWHAIDTIERHALGWVLSADHLTFLLPRASFADTLAERAFVSAIVANLSDAARARSPAAAAFVSASA